MTGPAEPGRAAGGEPEPSPADAVRRALRAARERREAAPDAAGEQGLVEPSDGRDSERGVPASEELAAGEYERRGARPGDAARAALRRAVVARRGGSEGAEEEAAQGSKGAVPGLPRTVRRPFPRVVPSLRGVLRTRTMRRATVV